MPVVAARRTPATRLFRGVTAAVAVAVLASGCAAGQIAQTADEKSTIDGTNAEVGPIALRNVAIEAPSTGRYYASGSDARLTVVLVNTGTAADQLTGVSSRAFGGWGSYSVGDAETVEQAATSGSTSAGSTPVPSSTSAPAESPTGDTSVTIGPAQRASFGVPDSERTILLTGLTRDLYPATTIKITFTFAEAGTVTVSVPVRLAEVAESSVPGSESNDEEQG